MSIPYMPLYVADYLGDTQHLSAEQHGAYLLILMALWRAGGRLPNDAIKLARIARVTPARWAKISGDLMAFFTVEEGEIVQKRLAIEIEKASKKSQVRSEAGRAGAEAKALKNNKQASANGQANIKHRGRVPEPEPEPDEESGCGEVESSNQSRDLGTPSEAQVGDGRSYAFEGRTIRLTGADLERWKRAFTHIGVEAELWQLDEWAGRQGSRWFPAVAGALASKNRKAIAALERAKVDSANRGTGPPARYSDPRL